MKSIPWYYPHNNDLFLGHREKVTTMAALPPPPPKPFTPPKRRQSHVGDAPPSFVPSNTAPIDLPQPNNEEGFWQSRVDPASNKTYYFHTVTEETTWVNPYEDAAKLALSAEPLLDLVDTEDDSNRPTTPPAAHSSFKEMEAEEQVPTPPMLSPVPRPPPPPPVPSTTTPTVASTSSSKYPSEPPPAYSFTAVPPPMPPSAISFMDVQVKYRFSSARRLITIQLDELKLTQVQH
jgi:hypothetical protein